MGKTKIIGINLLFLFMAFFLNVFLMKTVNALSCAPIFPIIGIIDNISVKGSYIEITLDKAYSFRDSLVVVNNMFNIDEYELLVNEYVLNNFQLPVKLSSENNKVERKVFIPASAFNRAQIMKGDIIINGPPRHLCDYGFTGIFTKEGKLKSAIISDEYQDYIYYNTKLEVEPGKPIKCKKYNKDVYKCQVEVNFKLDSKEFKLIPLQSYKSATTPIKSIFLLDSSELRAIRKGTKVSDWGIGNYVIYVLDFSNSLVTSQQPSGLSFPLKSLDLFRKIWHWFVLLFR